MNCQLFFPSDKILPSLLLLLFPPPPRPPKMAPNCALTAKNQRIKFRQLYAHQVSIFQGVECAEDNVLVLLLPCWSTGYNDWDTIYKPNQWKASVPSPMSANCSNKSSCLSTHFHNCFQLHALIARQSLECGKQLTSFLISKFLTSYSSHCLMFGQRPSLIGRFLFARNSLTSDCLFSVSIKNTSHFRMF